MVEVKTIQSLYFSPTGNVRRIVEAIQRGMGITAAKSIDLTLPEPRERWTGSTEGSLLIVGVPVYAGSFPSLLLPYLKKLNGADKWAVPVAVCGNAQMRTCLADLSGVLSAQGFRIAAAANFVGQHSFCTDEIPMGKGRPDRRDIRKAYSFGKKVVAKLKSGPTDISMTRGGNIWLRVYLTSGLEAQGTTFPVTLHSAIRVSDFDSSRCDNCKSCARSCPTAAIDPHTLMVDDAACIRCFACSEACPHGLRGKVVSPDAGLRAWFLKQSSVRAEPQVIL